MSAPGRPASRWQRRVAGIATALGLCALAACGSSSVAGPDAPEVAWYVGPDRLDAKALAASCTDQAAGAFTIKVHQMPTDVTARHALLARRLLAKDSSMDVLSLDSASTAEFAAAGFLAPVPAAQAGPAAEGVVPAALAAATYRKRLVAVPWFLDPQVLWFRGNTAERAGLDTTKPISWDDLVAGAQRLGVSVEIEDRDGSGLAHWVNALVAGGGGALLTGDGRSAKVGLDSDAGRAAASVVEFYRQAGVGPGPSADALTRFAGGGGGFLIASTSAISDPSLAAVQADMSATAYPAVGTAGVAPLAGVALAVPAHADHAAQARTAIACLTSQPLLQQLVTGAQHTPSRLSTLDDPAIATAFRAGDVAKAAVTTGVTAPSTPYWSRIAAAIDVTWQRDVSQAETPGTSQAEVEAAVKGQLR